MKKCLCCNHEFNEYESYDCPYCGFKNFETLQAEYSSDERDNADRHKKDVLSKIKKISMWGCVVKYNAGKNLMEWKNETNFFGDGTDGEMCHRNIVWSKDWISHLDKQSSIPIIRYQFAGRKKELKDVRIKLPAKEGIFYPGIQIDEDLRLKIWLGIEPVNSAEKRQTILLETFDLDLVL